MGTKDPLEWSYKREHSFPEQQIDQRMRWDWRISRLGFHKTKEALMWYYKYEGRTEDQLVPIHIMLPSPNLVIYQQPIK